MSLNFGYLLVGIDVIVIILAVTAHCVMERRLKKECMGYLLIDESDPEIDKGGGVYLQLFEAPTKLNDRSIIKIEIRKVNSTKKEESKEKSQEKHGL